jgi:hypothetical protein
LERSRALCCDARESGARRESERRHHRRTERQRCAKKEGFGRSAGLNAGKKVKGHKRHILVDTLDLLLNVVVHPADVQDRDGARLVLNRRTRRLFPFIERIFAARAEAR